MSRRRRNLIITVCLVLALVVSWLDRNKAQPLREAIGQQSTHTDDRARYHGKSFKVVNVVDGDTVDIDIPDGKYDHTRIRLLGVDTPEVQNRRYDAMHYGPEASAFTKDLALNKQVTVIIDTVGNVRDRYNRLLGYIELPNGKTLNEELIRNGYGYADLRFAHSHYDKYLELQNQALAAKTGLWQHATKEKLPKWLQREAPGILNKK